MRPQNPHTTVTEVNYEQAVNSFYEPLYGFAYSLSGNENDACELTQETFARLLSKSAQVREESKLKSWLFTTLYLQGQLRGCVGYVFAVSPIYEAVVETARAAASQDTRFLPVTSEEAPQLKVSLSILSPLRPIRPEEVQIGRHGLLVSLAGRRGLLLPQVPIEHHWDRETFHDQTCQKAGLPANAWKMGATLEGFTAEVFHDPDASP